MAREGKGGGKSRKKSYFEKRGEKKAPGWAGKRKRVPKEIPIRYGKKKKKGEKGAYFLGRKEK